MTKREYQDRPALATFLFQGDRDFVSEDGVQKILSGKITLPAKAKIAMLRQAGDRLQADLLLVDRVTSDVCYDSHLLSRDQVKTYSAAEAVLFDIRTEINPITSVATRDVLSENGNKEIESEETMKRTQKEVALTPLNAVADDLVRFFKAVY